MRALAPPEEPITHTCPASDLKNLIAQFAEIFAQLRADLRALATLIRAAVRLLLRFCALDSALMSHIDHPPAI